MAIHTKHRKPQFLAYYFHKKELQHDTEEFANSVEDFFKDNK